MRCRPAQSAQLRNGLLVHSAVSHVQFSGNGQHLRPLVFLFRIGIVAVRHAHPANENASAGLVLVGLGRIEVKTVVVLLKFRQGVVPLQCAIQQTVSALINVLVHPILRLHALRREREHLGAVQPEEIRTLPHEAERLRCGDGACQRPVQQIAGTVHQHLSHIVPPSCAQHHVSPRCVLPDLGVTHMAGHIAGVVAVAQKQCLFPEVHAVPTARPNGVVLSAVVDVVVAVTGFLDIAGVEQVEHPVILQRRAGVNAVAVELFVAAKRRLVVLVMDEIRRFEVPPVVQPRLPRNWHSPLGSFIQPVGGER